MDELIDPLEARLGATLTDPRHALPDSLVSLEAVHRGAAARHRHRHRHVAGAVAAALVLVSGGTALSLWRSDRQEREAASPATATNGQVQPAASVRRPLTAGLRAVSVTAASTSQFWLLGAVTSGECTGCLVGARTTDAGTTLAPLAVPAEARLSGPATVLRFAGPRDAWLVSGGLWSSHDGAQTWQKVVMAGQVVAVEASAGHVWILVERDGHSEVWRSPTTSDAWAPATELGRLAGPVELAAGGGRAFVVSAAGLQVDDGTRVLARPSACGASTPRHVSAVSRALWIACPSPQGWSVHASPDFGVTFTRALGTLTGVKAIGAHGVDDAFVLGAQGQVVRVATHAAPAAVAASPRGGGTFVGFTNSRVGYAVLTAGRVWRTDDAGVTWHELRFGSAAPSTVPTP